MKRALALLLCLALCVSLIPAAAAEDIRIIDFETEPEQPELTDPEPQDVYGPPNWYTTDSEGNPVTDIEPQPDYGPPHWESETSTTAETTIFTEPITQPAYGPPYWETTVTEIIPQPAYGPPWMFAEPGDLNYDFQLDARDLTLLKRYLLEGEINDHIDRLANVNHDGKIDKEDVKELIRKLTGKPEDEEEPDVTTTATTATTQTADTETTTTDPWENYPLPLYGPPAAY